MAMTDNIAVFLDSVLAMARGFVLAMAHCLVHELVGYSLVIMGMHWGALKGNWNALNGI